MYDGSINIDTSINSKGFNSGVNNISASLSKLKSVITGLGAAIGVAFSLAAVVAFGAASVKAASDAQSAMIGLQSVVEGTGNSFSEAQDFINEFTSDGLIPAQNAIIAYKNLLLRGYDTTQIEQTLTALKDSAAFGRSAHLTLGEAVQTATEGLKNENSILVDNAGVTRNVSLLWRDYAESIGTTVSMLTQQQKIQAEVNGILNESRFQVGDAAKLAGTYAGQVGALSASFLNLKVAVGNSVIPVITAIIPFIRKAIDALTIFFNRVALIMSILFGVQIGAQANQTASAMDNVASSTNSAADAQGKLAKNTEKANKAAKGSLASFDELNVLQQDMSTPDSGSGSGGAGDTSPLGDIAPITVPPLDTNPFDESLEELRAKVLAWKESFLQFIQPVVDAFGRLVEALTPLGQTIWEGLKWAWDNILVPLGEWTVSDLIPAFLDLLAAAATVLNSALEALKPLGIWLWENFLQPLATWTGGVIINIIESLTNALLGLSDWIDNNQQAFRDMTVTTIAFIATWKIKEFIGWVITLTAKLWLQVTAWVASTAAKIADKIETLAIMALYAGDFLLKLGLAIAAIWSEVAAWTASTLAKFLANAQLVILNVTTAIWTTISTIAATATWAFGAAMAFLASPIGLVIITLVLLIGTILYVIKHWEQLSTTVNQLGFIITFYVQKMVDDIKKAFDDFVDNAFKGFLKFGQDLAAKLREIREGFINTFFDIRASVQNTISTMITTMKAAFSAGLDAVVGFFADKFNTIKATILSIVHSIISIINGMISRITNGINSVINNVNSITGIIPGIPSIATISAPQIPQLATGAVIPPNAKFLAMLGDQRNGTNIETPVKLMEETFKRVLGNTLGDQTITINFSGSTAEIARLLKPAIDKENSRRGASLIRSGL